MEVSQHICHCILGFSQVGLNNSDPSLHSPAHYFIGTGAVSQMLLSKPRLPSLTNKETIQFITQSGALGTTKGNINDDRSQQALTGQCHSQIVRCGQLSEMTLPRMR